MTDNGQSQPFNLRAQFREFISENLLYEKNAKQN